MLYLIFLTVIFNLATASLPPLSPQRYIHRTVFTFQATRFCGAGCCWLPAAGAPPPSQLRTEAEAKREREGERTDGGRIVHLWGRETMTNRSKTETTTAESKGQRCHLHWRYYDTMKFALFSNKSPFKFGVYTQQILQAKVILDLKQKPSYPQYV